MNNFKNEPVRLPSWMDGSDPYEPQKDREGFLTKSLLKLGSILALARDTTRTAESGASAVVKLIYTLLFIVLISVSKNMFFTYLCLAGFLVRCTVLPSGQLLRVFRGAVPAMLLSMLLLLPAVFLGQPRGMLTVSLKVFLSVGLLGLMAVTTPWNKMTEGLRFFRIPDIFIFTLDITIKYIVILGDVCVDMLTALKLRSVGKNQTKAKSLSGVLGVTFLKSQQMAADMNDAMMCRGFEGEYPRKARRLFRKQDLLYVLLMAAVTALFIYLEGAMQP